MGYWGYSGGKNTSNSKHPLAYGVSEGPVIITWSGQGHCELVCSCESVNMCNMSFVRSAKGSRGASN